MRIGYACINLQLHENGIHVNRGMIKKTFQAKGISYASELALQNITDLEKVVDWNIENKILLYRMSSDMFPWMSEYELNELPDIGAIKKILARIGEKAAQNNLRMTYHPGPFNVLSTKNEEVLVKTVKELRQHAEIMDMANLPESPYSKINIHIGGAFGDKKSAMERFSENYIHLPWNVKRRLTVENDDKINMFSLRDLLFVHEHTGIPLVFDFLHHDFCTGGWSAKKAFDAAIGTWPADEVPVIHISSSKKIYEDPDSPGPAHADFIYEKIKSYVKNVDVMLEAKAKERAVMKYISEFKSKAFA